MGRLSLLLLAAGLEGCELTEPELVAETLWPFSGASAVPPDGGVLIRHADALEEEVYGLERPFTLTGPSGEVELSAELEEHEVGVYRVLRLRPEAPLEEGEHRLEVDGGSDSENFRSIYRAPQSLHGSYTFSTASTPRALCATWYDYIDDRVVQQWARGRQLCLHFSEALVPSAVDLGSDQLTLGGDLVKTSGDVPESFPELLCVLLPDDVQPLDWILTIEADDVRTQAGGELTEALLLNARDLPDCHALPWVLPRWRPDED